MGKTESAVMFKLAIKTDKVFLGLRTHHMFHSADCVLNPNTEHEADSAAGRHTRSSQKDNGTHPDQYLPIRCFVISSVESGYACCYIGIKYDIIPSLRHPVG